jgi:hypothetical protein
MESFAVPESVARIPAAAYRKARIQTLQNGAGEENRILILGLKS